MNLENTIKDFKEYLDRLHMYYGAMALMGFDAQTIAPKGGIAARAKREGFFAREVFLMKTSNKMKGFLDVLGAHADSLDPLTFAMYRNQKREYDKNTKVPPGLVEKFYAHQSKAYVVWEKAKANNDFASFAPYLRDSIAMTKEMLKYRQAEGQEPYNLLLDDFEQDMTMEIYDAFFAKLKAVIVPLLKRVMASEKKIDKRFLDYPVPLACQREIAVFLAEKTGYDRNRGYIGETEHPFCNSSGRDDVRITTHYYETQFLSSFYSVLHECGHAIYEQNSGDAIANTILDGGNSSGLHESQSRFYENIIGRSLPFWEHVTDALKTYLPASFQAVSAEQFYEAANAAEPSLIRIEADELSYSLHIIIRYELERLLFTEDIDVMELPGLWNQKYEEYLGITPPDDSRGILQDVHWTGMYGYFPTYALGSAYAAQFLAYMRREMEVDAIIRSGDLTPITNWLKDKIHRHGSVYSPRELMERIHGEQLNADYYTAYLEEKFGTLYAV